MTAAVHAHETGTPVLRAMLLEFPEDRTAWTLDRQYMLGPALLIAPIFDPSGTVEYYVPAGRWVGLLDKRVRTGPAWVMETHGFESLPVLVRPGEAVVMGVEEETTQYDFREKGFDIVINGVEEGRVVDVRVGANGEERVEVVVQYGKAKVAGAQEGKLVVL